jgi:DNA-binding HxlR family transcriptional regulator
MARAAAHDPHSCEQAAGTLERAFEFLGKRWSAMVIGELRDGPLRFADLRRTIPKISDSVLSDRLTELAEAGIVLREVHAGPPLAVSYELTPCGAALVPALDELAAWAGRHLPERPAAAA